MRRAVKCTPESKRFRSTSRTLEYVSICLESSRSAGVPGSSAPHVLRSAVDQHGIVAVPSSGAGVRQRAFIARWLGHELTSHLAGQGSALTSGAPASAFLLQGPWAPLLRQLPYWYCLIDTLRLCCLIGLNVFAGVDESFRCTDCDFDLCRECFKKKTKQKEVCVLLRSRDCANRRKTLEHRALCGATRACVSARTSQ